MSYRKLILFTEKQNANYGEDTKSSKFKVTEFHEGEKRIPSNDNCDYTLVVNYLLIIIPNHSDCTFGTIFFFLLYKRCHEMERM